MATIEKRNSGWYQAKVRRTGFPVQSKTFQRKSDAEAWARRIETEIDRGDFIDQTTAKSKNFREILERYRDEVSPLHKGAEVEVIRINALLRNKLAEYKMSALSNKALNDYINERLKIVKQATVRRDLDLIRQVIEKSRKSWGIKLAENPVSTIELPPPSRARDRRLKGDEEQMILSVLENIDHPRRNPWIAPFFKFAIETAMRQGEETGVLWEHVNLSARTIHLYNTKNGEDRIVPLSSRALFVLTQLIAKHDTPTPTGRIFPITKDALKKAWQRCLKTARKKYEADCQAAAVPIDPFLLKNLRWHDLRHEATSRLAAKLPNILELSAVTGHKDVRMLKRYFHPDMSAIAQKLG